MYTTKPFPNFNLNSSRTWTSSGYPPRFLAHTACGKAINQCVLTNKWSSVPLTEFSFSTAGSTSLLSIMPFSTYSVSFPGTQQGNQTSISYLCGDGSSQMLKLEPLPKEKQTESKNHPPPLPLKLKFYISKAEGMPGEDLDSSSWDFTGIESVTTTSQQNTFWVFIVCKGNGIKTSKYKKIQKQYDSLERTQGQESTDLPMSDWVRRTVGLDFLNC